MDNEKQIKLTPCFDLLEASIKTWWQNIKKIVYVYLWGFLSALLPLVIIAFFLGINYWFGAGLGLGFRILTVIVSALGFLVSIYFFIRAYLGIFLLVKHNYTGKEEEIFRETRQIFWPYIGLTLLTGILVCLWSLLLIIPGIIYSVLYSLAVYVLIFEDKRGMDAIRRSLQLTRNYFWPLLGRIAFIGVCIWIVSLIIAAPISFTSKGGLLNSLWTGVVQVINFLIGPIVLIYMYNIYLDLVKIKK